MKQGSGAALHPLSLEACSMWRVIWIQSTIRKSLKKKTLCHLLLDVPVIQWSQAYCKVHQDFVSEVLEDSTAAITLTWPEPHRKSLVDLKKAAAACKPINITELEVSVHEERTKTPQERCQKLVSGYVSHLQKVITAKGFMKYWRHLRLMKKFNRSLSLRSLIFLRL